MKAIRFIYNLPIFWDNFCPYHTYSFDTYLHKITEKTTTGLISDENAERIKKCVTDSGV